MIKGEKRKYLTMETVMQKITPYDIFRYYMPTEWKVGEVTHSPFREERHPSFIIGQNNNTDLRFIDFGEPDKRGDCFEFVKVLFNIPSIDDVLKKIDKDFGLGISSSDNVGKYESIRSSYKQPEERGKLYSLIQIKTRKFTEEELAYWKAYYQTEEDLKLNHIYSIKEAYLNRRRLTLSDLRFGYLYGTYWKIYQPHASKKQKWICNVPISTAYGLENLKKGKNTLICKSLKDYLVCIKIYPYVCHVQNESLAAFSKDVVEYIKENSAMVFYGGDSDAPGKTSSYVITEQFGFKHINPPDRLLPEVKDFADWGKVEGLDALREHFKTKGLI